ncbi:FAD/NAD(P)-binding domain-containing protein [Dendrothele bispora CBS 962.96]|uniref:FAD/NAD(P)-binding domain-containing protein n=1 Tax=Dendrothele bispora (strain CBS 962.96) TaxID=1314807 RepID=A0A4S8M868_DENBC|nr:FAD/NAD(P)-binding domain-containing protein [Dendrothele bispora CBS 962.96]
MSTDNLSDVNTPRKLRMAIIGGGIGGLSLAVSLGAQWPSSIGVDVNDLLSVDLYESAAQITEIGAGITVWPRTWRLLKAIGLEKDLKEALSERERSGTEGERLAFSFRKSDQSNGFTFHQLYMPGGGTCFHRQDVQKTLLAHLPSFCQIHLNHRLTSCTESSEEVILTFQNGKTLPYDLVVGADGIHSVTRNSLSGSNPKLYYPYSNQQNTQNGIFYTGTIAYRGLIPREKMEKLHPGHRTIEEPVIYCGKSRHIVVYPISRGRIINVVAFASRIDDEGKPFEGPTVRNCTTEEVLEAYKGWEPEAIQLLECIEKPTCWTILDLMPLGSYISPHGRVGLLGDASHAILVFIVLSGYRTPHLGAGAGQAMEDSYILGGIVSRLPYLLAKGATPTKNDLDQIVPHMLQVYDTIRQPFGNSIMMRARKQGFYYEFNAEELVNTPKSENGQATVQPLENSFWIPLLQNAFTNHWSWAWKSPTAEDDLRRAEDMLKMQYHESNGKDLDRSTVEKNGTSDDIVFWYY